MRTVSWTQLNTYSKCKRAWGLKYQDGWHRPEEDATRPMRLGRVVHALLAQYYGGQAIELDNTTQEYADAWIIFNNYLDEADDSQLEISTTEQFVELDGSEAQVAFGSTWPCHVGVTGFIDAVGSSSDPVRDRELIVEHKTTAYTINSWSGATLYNLKWQALFYQIIYDYITDRPHDILFNVIRNVKGTPRAARPLTWRHFERFNPSQIEAAKHWFTERVRRMDYDRLEDLPPEPGAHCQSCEFLMICPSIDDGSRYQELLEANYTRKEGYV